MHNLPIIADIIAHAPGAQIDWVVEEAFADIPRLHPRVGRVIAVATRRWRRRLYAAATWREIGAARRALRARRYDLVLDTQGLLKSALIAAFARGPAAGQDRATARERFAAMFYQRTFHIARGRHAVVRNRDLAAHAFGYALPRTPPDYGLRATEAPQLPASLPRAYVVCFHGTSRESKRWPQAHWIAACQALRARGLASLLPWGSVQEEARAREIAAQVADAFVLPAMRLSDLAGILRGARGSVGVDTGLIHLAAAFGVPTVAIYVDSSPALTGVLPAEPDRARNLGGEGAVPTAEEVIAAAGQVGIA